MSSAEIVAMLPIAFLLIIGIALFVFVNKAVKKNLAIKERQNELLSELVEHFKQKSAVKS